MVIEQIIDWLGDYNSHLMDSVSLQVAGRWYWCYVKHLPDIEHLLTVHPVKDGKINVRFDTGLCGQDALANDLRPASQWLASCGAQSAAGPTCELRLRWNPMLGQDSGRLFYGGFEKI